MKTYQRGESIYVSVEIRTLAGALTNVTSVAVSIYDPKLTAVVSSSAMSNDATGKYSLSTLSAATWIRGTYLCRVEITNGSDKIYVDEEFFLEVLM